MKEQTQNQAAIPNIWRDPKLFIAFGFGSGLMPFAQGTFATLFAIPLYCVMAQWPLWIYTAVVLIAALWGIKLSDDVERIVGVADYTGINWDEFVGFWVTMIGAPVGGWWILWGFILFRLFDIWKPWPISWAEKFFSGGLGIMIDDVLAGAYAWIMLQILIRIFT